ncbi:chorismate synthase [Papillibacter cinnamivorans]|uniref:Chorismate synthase n=1 Tax=Papillibacter cinnamivorans DSM 12816 TaxID=1122930 RepID=A0A1W2BUX4_9FIRM|nr:chorismate synthase [Papillibacter cinnamivorans]SMC76681.1 chorismate synthase [Papillibacter cinnamivorans DSM 12816]
MKYMLFGESHGPAVGVVLEGVPPGIPLEEGLIRRELERRAPGKNRFSTPRREEDAFEILSGVFEGKTTGTPLCALIRNTDVKSGDYEKTRYLARPGHADYTGHVKYRGFEDYRGGGHFSGRLTAPLVFAGSVARQVLAGRSIAVGAHILEIHGKEDASFDPVNILPEQLAVVAGKAFPVLDDKCGTDMMLEIDQAREARDSVGGVVECAVLGLPAGAGAPGQDSAESILSRHLFAVPAVKGVSFGAGFRFSRMLGSEANDPIRQGEAGIILETNHSGGINGGITNAMPLVFSVVIRPTPSIGLPQRTVNLETGENAELIIEGRHDPCIVPRAVPVIEAAAALAVWEILEQSGEGAV